MESDSWQELVHLLISKILKIHSILVEHMPEIPLNYESITEEDKENYKRKFYDAIIMMHDSTASSLTNILPFYYIVRESVFGMISAGIKKGEERNVPMVEKIDDDDLPQTSHHYSGSSYQHPLFKKCGDYSVEIGGETLLLNEAIARILVLIKNIITNVESYFILSFTNIPGWKILSSIIDSNVEQKGKQDVTSSAIKEDPDNIPHQVLFFMEICKIRSLYHCVEIIQIYMSLFVEKNHRVQATPKMMTGIEVTKFLGAQNLLPGSFRYMRFVHNNKLMNECLSTYPLEFCLMFYSQEQVETSLTSLFLELNLIPYSGVLEMYLQNLLNRACWFFICPQDPLDLNISRFSTEIQQLSSQRSQNQQYTQSHFYWPDQTNDGDTNNNEIDTSINISYIEEILYQPDDVLHQHNVGEENNSSQHNQKHFRTPNIDYTYRLILRYIVVLQKLFARNSLKPSSILRHKTLSKDIKKMSTLIQSVVNNKFKNIHQKIKGDTHKKHQQLLYPPSDKEWVRYKHKLEYINESSIIEILYPELRNTISSMVNKDITKIFFHPQVTEASLFEYMVLQVVKLLIGQIFDFDSSLICLDSQLPKRYLEISSQRKMPILVQSFNRFSIYYKKELHEFVSIFDCLASLFNFLTTDFPSEKLTFYCTHFIKELEKTQSLLDRQQQKASSSSTSSTIINPLSSAANKTGFDTDPNKAAHMTLEYQEELKEQESKTFLNCND
jgi:hypothetical protein